MREKLDFSNSIKFALDESLKRLQTDYLDVYQLHWPGAKRIILGNAATVQEDAGKITFTLSWKLGWFCKSWKKKSYWVVK
jgi:diketogulonate reductase-like aldo/keto reductase